MQNMITPDTVLGAQFKSSKLNLHPLKWHKFASEFNLKLAEL